jgi:hypothetical protein
VSRACVTALLSERDAVIDYKSWRCTVMALKKVPAIAIVVTNASSQQCFLQKILPPQRTLRT